MIYLILFLEFFKTGLFSIGGGLATIPFLYEMADKYPWFTRSMLGDMIAISESTPGPIGVNMATYSGIQGGLLHGGLGAGLLGGFVATFGLVLPSVIIIILVYKVFEKFKSNRQVQNAFYGIRPAVTGMIASAGLGMVELGLLNMEAFQATGSAASLFQIKSIILFVVLLVLTNKIKIHPIFYILLAGVVGVIFQF